MRFCQVALVLLVLLISTSCSYEEKRRTETTVEHSVDKFHETLNNEQYHEIYSQADAQLQGRISEAEFTGHLRNAHYQLGNTSGKAIVIVDDSIWRGLRRVFGPRREIVIHWNSPASDRIIANERFGWAVENNQAKLILYEFRPVCQKPCAIGFGPAK